jgi:hypothetical protein
MKTEYRSIMEPEATVPVTFTWHHGTPVPNQPSFEFAELIVPTQVLWEEFTPNSTGSKSAWKSFEHFKSQSATPSAHLRDMTVECEKNDYGAIYQALYNHPYSLGTRYAGAPWFTSDPYPFGVPGKFDLNLPGFYAKRADNGFVPEPAGLDSLVARSLRTMLPAIKSELSLINSIIELKDFVSLPKTLKTVVSALPKLKRQLGKQTVRELLRRGSDVFLQAEFNIIPLVADICGVFTALLRTERRINDLISRSGCTRNMHWAFNWIEYPDVIQDSPYGPYGFAAELELHPVQMGPIEIRRSVIYEATTFHAEIRYNYNYTDYQVVHARLLALLDAFGVNLNPAIIWNAIPWSFVVDWVFGVSQFLSQFKTLNMKPMLNIQQYLWSVSRSRRIIVERRAFTLPYFSPPTPGPWIPFPAVYQTAYRREVSIPSISLIESSGVSSKEFTLAAALVLARRRRSHKR